MDRKYWLTTFLFLADSGAAAIDYRKKLNLKTNVLRNHINSIGQYRIELAAIHEAELITKKKAELAKKKSKKSKNIVRFPTKRAKDE